MISKIIYKLRFIKKFPKKVAKPILFTIIVLDELFWKFRIFVFTLILGKKNKIGKALKDLKTTGVAVIPKFYSDDEALKIKEACIKILDKLGISNPYL